MQPQYQNLKQYVVSQIEEGAWKKGQKVCSDNELASQFGVSRMTANRALRELTAEGVLTRVPGTGTFVSEHVPRVPLFEIRNIRDEIEERGNAYRSELCLLESTRASRKVAAALDLPLRAEVFHSIVIHHENDIPVQLEDRHVKPAIAPDYLEQDFSRKTPTEYLMKIAPVSEVQHIIEAVLPDETTAERLQISQGDPCLLLYRRTWSGSAVATASNLVHPASRYQMGGRFIPNLQPVFIR